MADRYWLDVYVAGMTDSLRKEFVDFASVDEQYDIDQDIGAVDGFGISECTIEDRNRIDAWLCKRGLAYLIHEEGKYEYMPEAHWYIPGMEKLHSCITNTDFEPVITVQEAIEAAHNGTLEKIDVPPTLQQLANNMKTNGTKNEPAQPTN